MHFKTPRSKNLELGSRRIRQETPDNPTTSDNFRQDPVGTCRNPAGSCRNPWERIPTGSCRPRAKLPYRILSDPKNSNRILSEVVGILGIGIRQEVVGCRNDQIPIGTVVIPTLSYWNPIPRIPTHVFKIASVWMINRDF